MRLSYTSFLCISLFESTFTSKRDSMESFVNCLSSFFFLLRVYVCVRTEKYIAQNKCVYFCIIIFFFVLSLFTKWNNKTKPNECLCSKRICLSSLYFHNILHSILVSTGWALLLDRYLVWQKYLNGSSWCLSMNKDARNPCFLHNIWFLFILLLHRKTDIFGSNRFLVAQNPFQMHIL